MFLSNDNAGKKFLNSQRTILYSRNAMLEKISAKESHLYEMPSQSIPSQLTQHIQFTKAKLFHAILGHPFGNKNSSCYILHFRPIFMDGFVKAQESSNADQKYLVYYHLVEQR